MGVTKNKKSKQQNHRLRTDSSLSHRGGGGGGLNAFYWYQTFCPYLAEGIMPNTSLKLF